MSCLDSFPSELAPVRGGESRTQVAAQIGLPLRQPIGPDGRGSVEICDRDPSRNMIQLASALLPTAHSPPNGISNGTSGLSEMRLLARTAFMGTYPIARVPGSMSALAI